MNLAAQALACCCSLRSRVEAIEGGESGSPTYTVATLPTGSQGHRAIVTDATAPTFLGALVGGGAVVTPVFHNGTDWRAG